MKKEEGRRNNLVWLLPLVWLATSALAFGQLSASVEPGYEFETGERITYQKMNLLGIPTITISGTVPGATVSTNSIGKVHLLTNVFDQVTIIGGDNVAAYVATNGITSTQMATNSVENWAIVDNAVGAGKIDTAAVDTDAIEDGTIITDDLADSAVTQGKIADDTITEANMNPNWLHTYSVITPATGDLVLLGDVNDSTNAALATVQSLLTAVGAAPAWSTNGLAITSAGAVLDAAHGLGRVPYQVQGWLVCATADDGYAVGDQVSLNHFGHTDTIVPTAFMHGVNATNVFVTRTSAGIQVLNKSTGAKDGINTANWTLSVSVW